MTRLARSCRFAAGAALLAATIATAAPREHLSSLVTGDVRLRSDEGLLLLLTEGGVGVQQLRFVTADGTASINVDELGGKRQLTAVRARAGRYRLERVATTGERLRLFKAGDPDAFVVEVVAGAISYPGDIYFTQRADGIKVRFGANSLDELAYTWRLNHRADDKLFESRPLIVNGPLGEALKSELDAPPQPEWRHADWLAHARLPSPAEQLAVVNRMLGKVGVEPLALGAKRAAVETQMKKLAATEGRLVFQGEALGFLLLAGRWGFAGDELGVNLFFEKDNLSRVSLRTIDGWRVWSAPGRDTYDDIKAYADEQTTTP